MFSKTNQINPLNYFNCRQFTKKPRGLEYLKLNFDWNDNGKISNQILVGFENPKELSIFNLSCPFIKRY